MAISKDRLIIDIEVDSNASKALGELNKTLQATEKQAEVTGKAFENYGDEVEDSSKSVMQNNKAVEQNIKQYKRLAEIHKKNADEALAMGIEDLNRNIRSLNTTLVETARIAADPGIASMEAFEQLDNSIDQVRDSVKDTITVTGFLKNSIADLGAAAGVAGAGIGAMKIHSMAKAGESAKEIFTDMTAVFAATGKSIFNLSAITKRNLIPSMLTLVETVGLLSPLMIIFGSQMEKSESATISFTGSMISMIGILSGSLIAGFALATSVVGGFIEKIGIRMVESMAKLQDKFIEFDAVMDQFVFVLRNFSQEMGENAVGSVEQWNDQLERLVKNTVFTRKEIMKSIQMIVAEGSILKLMPEQLMEISNVAADVATSTHRNITEVTQLIINALANSANSLLGLNIDIRDSTLEQGKMLKQTGLLVKQLTAQEKVQVRLAGIMKKTNAIRGAAIRQTKTIAGQMALLRKEQEQTALKIAETGSFTRAYIKVLIRLQRLLNSIPDPILSFVGNMRDLIGVTFIIVGNILKFSAAILGLILAMKALSAILMITVGVTFSVGAAFSFVLTKVFPIIAAVGFLVTAFDELMSRNEAFAETMREIGRSIGLVDDEMSRFNDTVEESEGVFSRFLGFIKNVFAQALIGLAQTINLVALSFVHLRKMMADDEDAQAYALMIAEIETRLNSLAKVSSDTWDALNIFSDTARAAESAQEKLNVELEKGIKLAESFKDRVRRAADDIVSGFDAAVERQLILGNQFERASAAVVKAQNEIETAFKRGGTEQEIANRLADARIRKMREQINLEKLRLDITQRADQMNMQASAQILEMEGRRLDAIRERTQAEIDATRETIDGLRKIGMLDEKSRMALERRIDLLKKVEELQKQAVVRQQQETFRRDVAEQAVRMEIERLRIQGRFIDAVKIENQLRLDAFDQRISKMREEMELSEKQLQTIEKTRNAIIEANRARERQAMKGPKGRELKGAGEISAVMSQAGGMFGEMAAAFGESMGGFMSDASAMFADMAASTSAMILGVILKIPELLDSLTSLVDRITDFPKVLYDAFQGLFDGLIQRAFQSRYSRARNS
jgi:hypothetical protein